MSINWSGIFKFRCVFVFGRHCNSPFLSAILLFLCFAVRFFSIHPGYRSHRSGKDAILKAKEYADEGYKYAVCYDLSKYFDTLNYKLLINMLREDIKDKRLISRL